MPIDLLEDIIFVLQVDILLLSESTEEQLKDMGFDFPPDSDNAELVMYTLVHIGNLNGDLLQKFTHLRPMPAR